MKFRTNLILGSMIIFSLFFIIPIGKSATETTIETMADKETYFDSEYPNAKWGNHSIFYLGNITMSTYNTFIHFNFTNEPSSFIKVEIIVRVTGATNITFGSCSLYQDDWIENDITYNDFILMNPDAFTTYSISNTSISDYVFTVDVTNFIVGNGISVYFPGDIFENGFFGYTKESEFYNLVPKLVWTYLLAESHQIIPGYSPIFFISAILITIIFLRRKINN